MPDDHEVPPPLPPPADPPQKESSLGGTLRIPNLPDKIPTWMLLLVMGGGSVAGGSGVVGVLSGSHTHPASEHTHSELTASQQEVAALKADLATLRDQCVKKEELKPVSNKIDKVTELMTEVRIRLATCCP